MSTGVLVMSRLVRQTQNGYSGIAVFNLSRGVIAEAATRTPDDPTGALTLDGRSLEIRYQGQDWAIGVQDVEGLVDLFIASDAQLALLPGGSALAAEREVARRGGADLRRLPTLAANLAALGLDRSGRAEILAYLTQRARNWRINAHNAPPVIAQELVSLARSDLTEIQPSEFRISIQPVRLQVSKGDRSSDVGPN